MRKVAVIKYTLYSEILFPIQDDLDGVGKSEQANDVPKGCSGQEGNVARPIKSESWDQREAAEDFVARQQVVRTCFRGKEYAHRSWKKRSHA
jgi:hypothetical protein